MARKFRPKAHHGAKSKVARKARIDAALRVRQGRSDIEVLFALQEGICGSCGTPMVFDRAPNPTGDMVSEDHVVARAAGGSNDLFNKMAMHRDCNSRKMDRPPNGCERIMHALVLARMEAPEWLVVYRDERAQCALTYKERGRATLRDLWPETKA